ncbi:hypothetical protein ABZW10_35970 [Kitasatospora sp. NPDC004723]|uniref:hypothetical protein n=1 Tax=Kitasatospora sp. NPDC004723 TaxID=3154288 RepID=UPI0033A1C75D
MDKASGPGAEHHQFISLEKEHVMADESVYNDPAYDISSIPSWKQTPPLHGAYAPNAKLSPRAKAGVGVCVVVLAAAGMVAWSNYSAAQADADVRKAEIALDASRVELELSKQQAENTKRQAETAGQESPAQKARREAVQACVAKAGGGYNAVSDCGRAFPAEVSPGMVNTASTSSSGGEQDGPVPMAGLVVLGAVVAVTGYGWAKKRFFR